MQTDWTDFANVRLGTCSLFRGSVSMGSSVSYLRDELFGTINEETPKYEEVEKTDEFEIRQYGPAIVAETTFKGRRDQGKARGDAFWVLASYIGAVSAPKNVKPPAPATPEGAQGAEAIAMTAPVIMQQGEPIAMTAPVVMQSTGAEPIAMTAPVIMSQKPESTPPDASKGPEPDLSEAGLMNRAMKSYFDWSGGSGTAEDAPTMSMQFILPSKYTMETVPKPLDPRVVVREVPGKRVGAVVFSGSLTEDQLKEKANKLKEALEAAGHKTTGQYMYAGYNSPMTLPSYRRNEVWFELDV